MFPEGEFSLSAINHIYSVNKLFCYLERLRFLPFLPTSLLLEELLLGSLSSLEERDLLDSFFFDLLFFLRRRSLT